MSDPIRDAAFHRRVLLAVRKTVLELMEEFAYSDLDWHLVDVPKWILEGLRAEQNVADTYKANYQRFDNKDIEISTFKLLRDYESWHNDRFSHLFDYDWEMRNAPYADLKHEERLKLLDDWSLLKRLNTMLKEARRIIKLMEAEIEPEEEKQKPTKQRKPRRTEMETDDTGNHNYFNKRRGNGASYGDRNPPHIDVPDPIAWFLDECNAFLWERRHYHDLDRRIGEASEEKNANESSGENWTSNIGWHDENEIPRLTAEIQESQQKQHRIRNSLQSLVDETATVCIEQGYDPAILYKLTEAAAHSVDDVLKYWPEVNAMLKVAHLKSKRQIDTKPTEVETIKDDNIIPLGTPPSVDNKTPPPSDVAKRVDTEKPKGKPAKRKLSAREKTIEKAIALYNDGTGRSWPSICKELFPQEFDPLSRNLEREIIRYAGRNNKPITSQGKGTKPKSKRQ